MADITIAAAISANTHRAGRSQVWISESIGYQFYIADDVDFAYSKTTDGGSSWAPAIQIGADETLVSFDVWYDKWTPSDGGDLIHFSWFGAVADDVFYANLDTANDDLISTPVVVEDQASATGGIGSHCSITKAVGGNLYVSWELDASGERGFERSTDGGATWEARAVQQEATGDWSFLFPANAADSQDIWALYFDADADALTLKAYDNSDDAWTESDTIASVIENPANLIGRTPFSASLRHSDGHLIVAVITEYDSAGSDHRVFDVDGTGSITELTAIAADADDHYYPAVFIHQGTNHIYVAYNGKRDGSEALEATTKVYYTVSTDNGTTWSPGDSAYMDGDAAPVSQTWTPLMGPRFYVSWRRDTVLEGNAINSMSFTAVTPSDDATGQQQPRGNAGSFMTAWEKARRRRPDDHTERTRGKFTVRITPEELIALVAKRHLDSDADEMIADLMAEFERRYMDWEPQYATDILRERARLVAERAARLKREEEERQAWLSRRHKQEIKVR